MWFSASEKPGSLQIWDVRWERENNHLATILPYHQWLSSLAGDSYLRPTALSHLGETLRQRQSVIIPQIVPLHYWIVSQHRLSAVSVGWETCTVIEKSPSSATIKAVIAWAHLLLTFLLFFPQSCTSLWKIVGICHERNHLLSYEKLLNSALCFSWPENKYATDMGTL